MHRRTFLAAAAGGLAAGAPIPMARTPRAAVAAPAAALPDLSIALTDQGFEIPQPLAAGRYEVRVANRGTLPASHFAVGRFPDGVTDAQIGAWLASEDAETEAIRIEEIGFVGVPDWPPPRGAVRGAIDLAPGRYVAFDPLAGREPLVFDVTGEPATAAEPPADLTVTLREMAIDLPEAAFAPAPRRWKIANAGAMCHEVAVLALPPGFTEEHLKLMLSLPDDATPPPGAPALDYQPVAAIGILAPGHASWLDVRLAPGRYLAACMVPFGTGQPHAADGMYRFFEVA